MPRDQVFISYSHEDKEWLARLQINLKPHLRAGSISSWSDEQIAPGSEWFGEIKSALAQSNSPAGSYAHAFCQSPTHEDHPSFNNFLKICF
jgi:hypothetical protein